MRQIIVSTHCNRPKYTKQWIDKLKTCDSIANTKIIACVEPTNEEVISLLRGIDYCEKDVVVNPTVFGSPRNSRQSMELGFKESEFVIHCESDCLLSKDAITECYRVAVSHKDTNYPAILLFNRHWDVSGMSGYKECQLSNLCECEKFTSMAYGAWKDKYSPVFQVLCDETCPQCIENPQLNYPMMTRASDFENLNLSEGLMHKICRGFSHPSQDLVVNNFFQYHKKPFLMFCVGRVINIGKELGIHVKEGSPYDDEWWKKTIQCDIWADTIQEHLNDISQTN